MSVTTGKMACEETIVVNEQNQAPSTKNKADETKRVHFKSLFELRPDEIIDEIKLTAYSETIEKCSTQSEASLLSVGTITISDKRQCSLCSCDFVDRDQQTEHYKLDWHRFNLKRRLCELQTISESEFNNLMQDQDDLSSISGSESDYSNDSNSDNEESSGKSNMWIKSFKGLQTKIKNVKECETVPENRRVSLKLFFTNSSGNTLSLHRCLLYGKRDAPELEADIISNFNTVMKNSTWAVILIGGGHFAAGIFNENELVEHKTFHRYTVRAKQGSAQGQRDTKQGGSHPKSAGSALRRYNESALVSDIQMLLSSWENRLNSCSLIFYRAPSFNRTALFSNKNPPFKKDDKRLRNIPFATRRATLREVKRVHQCLSCIEIIPGNDDQQTSNDCPSVNLGVVGNCEVEECKESQLCEKKVEDVSKKKKKKKKKTDCDQNSKRQTDPESDTSCIVISKADDDVEYRIFNHLYTLCKSSECKELNNVLSNIDKNTVSIDTMLNKSFGDARLTLLHLSAKVGAPEIVKTLLYHGADPSVVNSKQQTPYVLAKNEKVRDIFRDFKAQHPDKFDYILAKIPDPVTKQTVKKKRKPKSTKKASEEMTTNVEKPAVIPANPCTVCSKDLSAITPFECYNLKFCSTDCVRKFRTRQVR